MTQGEGGAGSLRRDWGELAGNSKVGNNSDHDFNDDHESNNYHVFNEYMIDGVDDKIRLQLFAHSQREDFK